MGFNLKRMAVAKTTEPRVRKEVEKALGPNPTLSGVARMMRGLVRTAGIPEARSRIIKWVETDCKNAVRENRDRAKAREVIDSMIENAMATPEYVGLLADVGMDRSHLETLRDEALANS